MTKSSFPLPEDWRDAVLVGRIDMGDGPTPVVVKEGRVFDVSGSAPTVTVPCVMPRSDAMETCWPSYTRSS